MMNTLNNRQFSPELNAVLVQLKLSDRETWGQDDLLALFEDRRSFFLGLNTLCRAGLLRGEHDKATNTWTFSLTDKGRSVRYDTGTPTRRSRKPFTLKDDRADYSADIRKQYDARVYGDR